MMFDQTETDFDSEYYLEFASMKFFYFSYSIQTKLLSRYELYSNNKYHNFTGIYDQD